MSISYKKLFHLLLDRNLKESQLKEKANISAPTLLKLKADKIITSETIDKICKALNCQPADIMEYIPDKEAEDK